MTALAHSILRGLADPADAVAAALERMVVEGSADPDRFKAIVVSEARTLRTKTLRTRRQEAPIGLLTDLAELEESLAHGGRGLRPFFAESFDTAVRDLPDDERDAWVLTELRGITDREAAEHLGVSHMTVNRRRKQAVIRIREELAA